MCSFNGDVSLEMLRQSCLGSQKYLGGVRPCGSCGPSELLKSDCTLRMTSGRVLARSWSAVTVGSVDCENSPAAEERKGRAGERGRVRAAGASCLQDRKTRQ